MELFSKDLDVKLNNVYWAISPQVQYIPTHPPHLLPTPKEPHRLPLIRLPQSQHRLQMPHPKTLIMTTRQKPRRLDHILNLPPIQLLLTQPVQLRFRKHPNIGVLTTCVGRQERRPHMPARGFI